MTLEYGMFKSEFPKLEFVTPAVFRERYKKQELPLFDVIISYSSLEHSGLGRYGDAINPWGDILTIARVSCVSSPDAKLLIGVPVAGVDRIEFNAARYLSRTLISSRTLIPELNQDILVEELIMKHELLSRSKSVQKKEPKLKVK
ncbi:uncharacterized protein LOC111700115 [Eurytemora carolleeae]|uniref:uncharacterized protein LOC111700115 n=1 Tax=Eurytemora carolleeae TaxID=1294199 RepID=UPI000C769956|nr:uncharacterized protein LOC111700115 [Eurytemora carolleeae]|eukprot:XP_023326704.1 uncharacterized protein LOC111700115 [Eurytemora affinis]